MSITSGQFKQSITKIMNGVYKDLFSIGLKKCCANIFGDYVVINSEFARLPSLVAMDKNYPEYEVIKWDALINHCIKSAIRPAVKKVFPSMNIISVFEDYDKNTETVFTIIVFEKNIESCLDEIDEALLNS
ncbi:MAG: hypothetical protein ACI4WG_04380 [Erysipelotrichaceae bacterium]